MFKFKKLSSSSILIYVRGALDIPETCSMLILQLEKVLRENYRECILDFSKVNVVGVEFTDSLVAVNDAFKKKGAVLKIIGCNDLITRTFKIIKIDKILHLEKKKSGIFG